MRQQCSCRSFAASPLGEFDTDFLWSRQETAALIHYLLRLGIGHEIPLARIDPDDLDLVLVPVLFLALVEELNQAFVDVCVKPDQKGARDRLFRTASAPANALKLNFRSTIELDDHGWGIDKFHELVPDRPNDAIVRGRFRVGEVLENGEITEQIALLRPLRFANGIDSRKLKFLGNSYSLRTASLGA